MINPTKKDWLKLFREVIGRWENICWKCGGKGFWKEQIDGVKFRDVTCEDLDCAARRLRQCLDCGEIGELTRTGCCKKCGSQSVTEKIYVGNSE